MSIVHHPDYRPEREGPSELTVVDEEGNSFVVADGEPAWYERAFERVRSGKGCSVCGEKLQFPTVYWFTGADEDLYMHPGCARSLAKGILRDVEEIEATYGSETDSG